MRTARLVDRFQKLQSLPDLTGVKTVEQVQQLGDEYKVIGGVGPLSRTYPVRDRSGTVFACKEVLTEGLDSRALEAVMRAINLQMNLKHPFIVTPIDTFIDSKLGRLYTITQLVEKSEAAYPGPTHDESFLKERTIWNVAAQVIDVLEYLHSDPLGTGPIVHGAISPTNVLITSEKRIYVTDCGVPTDIQTEMATTLKLIRPDDWCRAPEVLESHILTPKADVWALGCLLYFLVFCKRPFYAQDRKDILMCIRRFEKPNPDIYHDKRMVDTLLETVSHSSMSPGFTITPSQLNRTCTQPIYSTALIELINACMTTDYRARPSIADLLRNPNVSDALANVRRAFYPLPEHL